MALHCPTCRTELQKKTKFCPNCGANLTQVLDDDPSDQGHGRDDVTMGSTETPSTRAAEAGILDDDATGIVGHDGHIVTMPPHQDDEDDGQTKAMPASTDVDGQTKAMPDPREADGKTKAMPESLEKPPDREITATAIADLQTGRILQERYRLDKILGKGGFGAVYLAQDLKLKRACVVKQMLSSESTSSQEFELYHTNFEREASLLVQLNHPGHPNIPEIYDYFSDATGNYLVMKYIEGQNLKDVLEQGEGKIPWREAVRYVVDVCSALNYMHTQGDEPVMHRDIKPANIVLSDDGRVWLLDFGLAKAKPVESTGDLMATQAAGSLGYTPLEQWLGEAVPTSDVYALGATLHHLVTGLHPMKAFGDEFNIEKLIDTQGQFVSTRKVDKGLPKQLDPIIARATNPDPEQRLTPSQLQQELEALISGTQAAALYTFKSGESAKTEKELVILCEQHRSEAQQYLYNGDFERWFLLLNRNDLAEAAAQAVRQGKNQKDGLEKFLKLIMPNIFVDRLGRATGRLARLVILFVLVMLVVVAVLLIGGSYGAGWFIRQSINNSDWSFDHLNLDKENRVTEMDVNEGAQAMTGTYFDELNIDMHPPDQIDIDAGWETIQFSVLVTLRLEDGRPHFYLAGINDIPLFLIGDNISQGINEGIDDVFRKAPVDVSQLRVAESEVVFSVAPSGRVPLPTPTPTPAPTPPVTPTPVGLALVAIFNELDEDIILEIEGESLEIAARGNTVIEKQPGTYSFVVMYKETGHIAAEGTKTWTVASYKWRISP